MGKSYTLDQQSHNQEYTNHGCNLTAVSDSTETNSDVITGSDEKDGAIKTDVEVEPSDSVEVKPGDKGDPFRTYRYAKQVTLVTVWVCLVS